FACGLYLGARLGGATHDLASKLSQLAHPLGTFIQVSDDLTDAMTADVSADWDRPANNLAMLYALSADHSDRDSFVELVARPMTPDRLETAQAILLRSGAVSYCALKLVELSKSSR